MLGAGVVEHGVKRARVFTVDRFDAATMTSGKGKDTFNEAYAALRDRDLLDTVQIIKADTAAAALQFEHVEFVFFDGDHSYDGALRDFLSWAPLAKELAFHDSNTEGVSKLLDQLPDFGWEKQGEVHTLTWWTK
jgi:hypothetical protein